MTLTHLVLVQIGVGEPMKEFNKDKFKWFWNLDKASLDPVVSQSTSLAEVLRKFNMPSKGGWFGEKLKIRCIKLGINLSHMKFGVGHNKGRRLPSQRLTLKDCMEKMLISNSSTPRVTIKNYIKWYSLIKYECDCGNKGEWQGKLLSLQLDHINGISNDNRIENLRFLCPNCHSQSDTYAGKKLKGKTKFYPMGRRNPYKNYDHLDVSK